MPRYVVVLRDENLKPIEPFEEGENYIKVGGIFGFIDSDGF